MDDNSEILVLKLSEGSGLPVGRLAQLADGWWTIKPNRILKTAAVIVMIHQKVEADYSMSNTIKLERGKGRINDLGLVGLENATELVGKTLHYPTQNPATITSLGDLRKRVN
jgi:hypothetical protein